MSSSARQAPNVNRAGAIIASMLGPRLTTVFRSRWRALWFAASVLLGVYFTVPRAGEKPNADEEKAAQAVAALLNQGQPAQSEHHANPWAKSGK